MTHPIRRILNELNDLLAAPPPPVDLDAVREPEDRKGNFWFKAGRKIAAKGDFTVMALKEPELFGFSPSAIFAEFEREHITKGMAASYARYLNIRYPDLGIVAPEDHYQAALRKGSVELFTTVGEREAGLFYTLSKGWGYVAYQGNNAMLWVDDAHRQQVIGDAADLFPMTAMNHIRIFRPGREPMNFYREDFPGFTGAFGAVMQWAAHGTVPEQNWLYAKLPAALVDANGIHGQPTTAVTVGNARYRDVFSIPCANRRLAKSMLGDLEGDFYRFPESDVRRLGLSDAYYRDTQVLYGRAPFVIPAAGIQRKSVGGWVPLTK